MPRQSKDAQGQGQAHRPPIDQYRKQIGKQDVRKSKSDLKETKKRAQAKKCMFSSYKDVGLMIGAMAVVVFTIYALLYFLLS